MRNLKKVLAAICVIAMMASMLAVPALAADYANEDKATTLNTLGVMAGMNLGDSVTRIQGLTFAIKAAGNDDEAQALTDTEVATILADVVDAADIPAWGLKYAAYAVKTAMTSGTDATVAPKIKFSPNQGVSGDSFLVWLLKSMGYTTVGTVDAWEVAVTDAKVLTLAQGYAIHGNSALIRDDVAGILYSALDNGVCKDGTAFVTFLINAGLFTQEAAAAAGLADAPAPAVLAVESVTADNLKAIVVKFNKEINKNKVTTNTVKVFDGSTLQSVTPLVLDDNKTVVVMSGSQFAQMKSYKLVIDGVELKDNSAEKVTGYENSIVVSDTTQPKIVNIAITSPKTIEITFNEPIQRGTGDGQFPVGAGVVSSIKNDGINVYVAGSSTLEESVKTNKINVTLGTALAAGDRTIKISGLKDYAGFPIADTEYVINVPADTTAPSIASAEMMTLKKVKVVFDEPVDVNTIKLTSDDFKIDGQQITGKANPSGDNKTFELSFTNDLTLAAIVQVNISYKGVKDHYGNEVSSAKTFTFTVPDETVAPTVTAAVVDNNRVELTFSENVIASEVTTASNYELYDKDNKKVYTKTFTINQKTIDGSVSDKVYTFDISGKEDMSGNYTIKILGNKIHDASVRKNALAETSLPLTLADKVGPKVTKVVYVNEANIGDVNTDADAFDVKITFYFNEAMDPATITNKSNFLIAGSYPGSNDTLTAAADNKSVVLILQKDSETNFNGTEDIRVLALKDAAGNMLQGAYLNADLNAVGGGVGDIYGAYVSTFTWANGVDKIELTSRSSIKLYMKDGYLIKSIDPNKISFTEVDAGPIYTNIITDLQVTGVTIASDAKTAVLTLNREIGYDAKADAPNATGLDADETAQDVRVYTNADGAIEIEDGAKLVATTADLGSTLIDKVAPELDKVIVKADAPNADNDEINIIFKEAVVGDVGYTYDIQVKDLTDDKVLALTTDFTVANAGGNIQITIIKSGVKDHRFSVEITNGRYLKDAAGNAIAAIAAKTVNNAGNTAEGFVTEKVVPVAAIGVTNNATTLILTYTEELAVAGVAVENGADIKAAYTVTDVSGGANAISVTSAIYNKTAKTVTITFANAEATDTFVSTVTDVAGNALDAANDGGTLGAGPAWTLD